MFIIIDLAIPKFIWKNKGSTIAETIWKRSFKQEESLLTFKTDYPMTAIKTCGLTEETQLDRTIRDPEIDPNKYVQLIFDTRCKSNSVKGS